MLVLAHRVSSLKQVQATLNIGGVSGGLPAAALIVRDPEPLPATAADATGKATRRGAWSACKPRAPGATSPGGDTCSLRPSHRCHWYLRRRSNQYYRPSSCLLPLLPVLLLQQTQNNVTQNNLNLRTQHTTRAFFLSHRGSKHPPAPHTRTGVLFNNN